MTKLFGTDGVRGKAGEPPLDHETVARLGGALARAMGASRPQSRGGKPLVRRSVNETLVGAA